MTCHIIHLMTELILTCTNCYYNYITDSSHTDYLLINHCLTRWAVTLCPTYGDCRAAIKDFQVGFFTLSSWFSHASMMCHPNSSSDSSLLIVNDFNPNLRPSLRYLLTVRSDSCSRTSSRSSLAKKENSFHELLIVILYACVTSHLLSVCWIPSSTYLS